MFNHAEKMAMSGTQTDPAKPGPSLTEAVDEVRGIFPSDSALQDAISRLSMAGFDRADISIPDAAPTSAAAATPDQGAENPNTEDDSRQARTLHTSMAASVGAMAAAGVVIATGGAALPAVVAAVAGGAGLGAITQGVTGAADAVQHGTREEAASRGELVLSVRLRDPAQRSAAENAMGQAGATRVIGGGSRPGTTAPG